MSRFPLSAAGLPPTGPMSLSVREAVVAPGERPAPTERFSPTGTRIVVGVPATDRARTLPR
jgi:hypothetical protein